MTLYPALPSTPYSPLSSTQWLPTKKKSHRAPTLHHVQPLLPWNVNKTVDNLINASTNGWIPAHLCQSTLENRKRQPETVESLPRPSGNSPTGNQWIQPLRICSEKAWWSADRWNALSQLPHGLFKEGLYIDTDPCNTQIKYKVLSDCLGVGTLHACIVVEFDSNNILSLRIMAWYVKEISYKYLDWENIDWIDIWFY